VHPAFIGEGIRIVFKPQEMEIFQANEEERSTALVNLTASGIHVLAAMDILGFDVSDDAMKLILENLQSEQERKEKFADRMARPKPIRFTEEKQSEENQTKSDLNTWRKKSIRNIKRNGKALVNFDSEDIPYTLGEAILGQLEEAMSKEDVDLIFENALTWGGYP
jgi:hypothetical protein